VRPAFHSFRIEFSFGSVSWSLRCEAAYANETTPTKADWLKGGSSEEEALQSEVGMYTVIFDACELTILSPKGERMVGSHDREAPCKCKCGQGMERGRFEQPFLLAPPALLFSEPTTSPGFTRGLLGCHLQSS
jgi:hypothetical protein